MLHSINRRSLLQQALLLRYNYRSWQNIKQAKRDICRRSKLYPGHHWIFDHFSAFRGEVPTNFHVTYIGDRVRDDIVEWEGRRIELTATPGLPPFDEEYFEWIDILQAVKDAGRIFTMLELGAGYGRWAIRAALAAFQLGKALRLGLAEADPKHQMWLKQCLTDNGISLESYSLFLDAVAGTRGECVFMVELPESSRMKNWFGQAIAARDNLELRADQGLYYGVPKMRGADGAGYVKVGQIVLSDVLDKYDDVDIVDMDIQGAEADAIEEGITLCAQKVRRLHIGTHGHDIEARLRLSLSNSGWVCLRDYPCGQINETDFGLMSFVDGVQSWVNPRLM